MKLANMKIPAKKLEEKPADTLMTDQPIYPWGLQVTLDEDSLAALGMTDLPKVGGYVMLTAKVCVTSVSSNEHKGGGKGKHEHRNVALQIEEMALDAEPAEKTAADALYSKA